MWHVLESGHDNHCMAQQTVSYVDWDPFVIPKKISMHIHKSTSIAGSAVGGDHSLSRTLGGIALLSNDAIRRQLTKFEELWSASRWGTRSSGFQLLGPPGRSSGCALSPGTRSSSSCGLTSSSGGSESGWDTQLSSCPHLVGDLEGVLLCSSQEESSISSMPGASIHGDPGSCSSRSETWESSSTGEYLLQFCHCVYRHPQSARELNPIKSPSRSPVYASKF